jgi:hypothetical protein
MSVVQEGLGHDNIATTMDLYVPGMRDGPRTALMPPCETAISKRVVS